MKTAVAIVIVLIVATAGFCASINSLDFMEDETVAGQFEEELSKNGEKTLKYVEQPRPSSQVIINNQRSDIVIQKKSSKVFRHSGSNGSEAISNIGGLKTNTK